MNIILLTSKSGINVNNKKSKYHKYDGKDTFCNSLKNDGLKYKHIIHRVGLKEYNYLKQNGEICKNCDMKKHSHKIMAENINRNTNTKSNRSLVIVPKGKSYAVKKSQPDIITSRIDKASFDAMQDISLGEE